MTITQIAVIIIFIVLGLYLIIRYKKELREKIYQGILYAEEFSETEEGKEKMQCAISYVYDLLPIYIKAIVPDFVMEKILKKLIQLAFNEIKKLLDYRGGENE